MASPMLNCYCLLFFFFLGFAASSPYISDHIFNADGSSGRSLLQIKKGCNVNFEFLNYTVITSDCKGPQYLPKLCCPAFKNFACPYRDQLNDIDNECATTMFSYINLYGKYPPGLFASECTDDKSGLDCEGFTNVKKSDITAKSTGCISHTLSLYIVAAALFVLLPQMF